MGNFDYKKWVIENKYGKLNEAKAEDAKSYLESKGLEVEMVSTGNEGDDKASKFKGVSDIDADKIAYIWNNDAGAKFDVK